MTEVNDFVELVDRIWEMKDLGTDPKVYLGLEFHVDSDGDVGITQKRMIDEMISKFNMKGCQITNTPHHGKRLVKPNTPNMTLPVRSLLGGLIYLGKGSKPEICYDIFAIARYMQCYDETIMEAGKRVLRYLKGVKDVPLSIKARKTSRIIEVWTDSDHVGDKGSTCKSVSGYVVTVFGVPVAWGSNANYATANDPTEAETVALHLGVKKAIAIAKILIDTHVIAESELVIHLNADNQGAGKSLSNIMGTSGVRHIRIKISWIRDLVEDRVLQLHDVRSRDNPADIFTKPLTGLPFRDHACFLNPNLRNQFRGKEIEAG